jgi:hypothetical protein
MYDSYHLLYGKNQQGFTIYQVRLEIKERVVKSTHFLVEPGSHVLAFTNISAV